MNQSRPRLPPLNALRAFEASARHLNFRLAAEELGVTQGAVAQHVRGLEADLGIKLFDRLPRTLALTGVGRSYAAQLRRAFDLLTQATATLRPEPLRLTISVSPTFASKWLIPRLPDFTAKDIERARPRWFGQRELCRWASLRLDRPPAEISPIAPQPELPRIKSD